MLKRIFAIALLAAGVETAAAQIEGVTTIGGYGEVHYNHDQSKNTKQLDFHRFVLFYGYQWSDRWSFQSEVELEHNLVQGGQGELELEQANINYIPSASFGVQVGVVLPSVGLINERHEPPIFLSVERPEYASDLIPTTWFGNGLSVFGVVKSWDYKVTVMEGLNADGFSVRTGIRGGRQKGYRANADHLLVNARLDYVGLAGGRFGASLTANEAFSLKGVPADVRLFELHALYNVHRIYAAAEYGTIQYSAGILKQSRGFYLDLGYDLAKPIKASGQFIPWVRYFDINPAFKTAAGGTANLASGYKGWKIGGAWRPIPPVVFKLDYGKSENKLTGNKSELFNLGAGYMF